MYYLSETSLHEHVINTHNQISLKDFPKASFFNLVSTLKNDNNTDPSHVTNIPTDFYVYQCLNCRLFFDFSCSFSHNCWAYVDTNQDQFEQKAPASNNNYFSPIYLKFNVSKLLSSKLNSLQSNTFKSSFDPVDV